MKIYSTLFILLSVYLINTENSHAQSNSYQIDFQINGWADTTAYLGYYYGESTYIKDTAQVNSNGYFTFEGDKELQKGVYFLVLSTSKIFEIIIDKNKEFKMVTSSDGYVEDMVVKGDSQNELFFENIRYTGKMNVKAQPFVTVLKDSLSTKEQKVSARNRLNEIGEEVKVYHNKIIDENEGTTLSTILKAQRNIEVPEAIKDDENQSFKYYRDHFWDNFELDNDVLIRVPESMYRNKMETYLDKLHMQNPDSIKKGIETLVLSSKANPETYKYVIWNLCLKYQTPKIMGQDQVFIYLYDTYFETGEMDYWANESLKKNLKERADQLRKSLVGEKAPNMILLDNNLQRVSLYDISNKYTIIYFFDPDCGHCKKETPKLNTFYKNTKHDVEVYAVSADTSMVKMQNYIKEYGLEWISANGPRTITPHYQTMYDANTTPTIYVLDEKKKIIAKKLEAERLEEFLTNYEKYQQ